MNIFYTEPANQAFKVASKEVQDQANSLLGTYAQYANRHSIPGKHTLKRISAEARKVLGLPAGTQVFQRGE